MKDKDKELLLKDLSARLPYGVNVKIITHKAYEVDRVLAFSDMSFLTIGHFADIRPYLRSMSSMTDREKREYWKTQSIWRADYCAPDYIDTLDTYDWLNANHFDYRGLIEKGLAIAATKENNPYKD